jgi:Tol biopolymer transport system component
MFASRSGAVQLSPDGSKVVFNLYYYFSDPAEQELFVMNTDGTNLTQLTHSSGVAWIPVAWSPYGKQILVNRIGGNEPSEIHIITVCNKKDQLVTTNASALDWYKKQ